MGRFSGILKELQDKNSKEWVKIKKISEQIAKENEEKKELYAELSDLEFTVDETRIDGIDVTYMYRKKDIMQKNKNGNSVHNTIVEVDVIWAVYPINQLIVTDEDVLQELEQKLLSTAGEK